MPGPVDWSRVRAEHREPLFVTFINPLPEKGVYPFVRIAHELGRPAQYPLPGGREPRHARNAEGVRAGTRSAGQRPDHAQHARPAAVLVPDADLADALAVVGEPADGGHRGDDQRHPRDRLRSRRHRRDPRRGGFLPAFPERLTPQSRIVPTAEEVEPWVEIIIRLWDDQALYQERIRLARQEALRWHPDRLRPLHAEFFSGV